MLVNGQPIDGYLRSVSLKNLQNIVIELGKGGAQELALVGHELQHALEIARAPNIRSSDDITELLSAQRKAAWADIARRIAHEIKNPLTPIQLSAERLRRKYLREIKKDPDTFRICTDTIIRHVEDIGRMVDEFSSFARMPAPVLKSEDLTAIVEQALVLERTAHPKIAFTTRFAARPVPVRCDARLVGQALINIVKNAVESIEGRIAEGGANPPGQITVADLFVEKSQPVMR